MSGDLALSTGLISGIDSGQLVEALTARQKEPINTMEQDQHLLGIKKEEYQSINSAMFAVEESLLTLSLNSTFNRKIAQTSTEGILSATATTDAERAKYEVNVTQLAQVDQIASDRKDSITESLLAEEATIEVNGVSLIVNAGVTLTGLKDAINATSKDSKVTARILDNTLVLSGTEMGADNAIELSDTSGTLLEDIGLIESYEPTPGADPEYRSKNVLKAAQNAVFTVDGLQISRTTNEVNDLIDEVKITLSKTGATTLEVKHDTEDVRAKVEDFVDKYNTAIELIYNKLNAEKDFKLKGLTKEELETMDAEEIDKRETELREQALSSDPILRRAYNMLRSITYSNVASDGSFSILAEIGISTGKVGSNKDETKIGKLQIFDSEKLDSALDKNMDSLRILFTQEAEEDEPKEKIGLAERFKESIRQFTSFNGILTRKAGRADSTSFSLIDNEIAVLQQDIAFKNRSLLKYQESLLQQFTDMETALAKLQEQSQQLMSSSAGGF